MIVRSNESPINLPPQLEMPWQDQVRAFSDRPFALVSLAKRLHGPAFRLLARHKNRHLFVFSGTKQIEEIIRLHEGSSPGIDRGNAYQDFLPKFPVGFIIKLVGKKHKHLREKYKRLIDKTRETFPKEIATDKVVEICQKHLDHPTDVRKLAEAISLHISLLLTLGDTPYARMIANRIEGIPAMPPGVFPSPALSLHERIRIGGRSSYQAIASFQILMQIIRIARSDWATGRKPDGYQGILAHIDPNELTLRDITSFATMMFGATTSLLENVLYYLSREHEARRCLETAIRYEDPIADKLVIAFAAEARRMSPDAIGFLRLAQRDISIDGWFVPKGSTILGCSYLAHRNESVFDRPNEFQLDRFLDRNYSLAEYFPYGVAKYACLGQAISKTLIATILPAIVRSYSLEGKFPHSNRVAHSVAGLTRRARPIQSDIISADETISVASNA